MKIRLIFFHGNKVKNLSRFFTWKKNPPHLFTWKKNQIPVSPFFLKTKMKICLIFFLGKRMKVCLNFSLGKRMNISLTCFHGKELNSSLICFLAERVKICLTFVWIRTDVVISFFSNFGSSFFKKKLKRFFFLFSNGDRCLFFCQQKRTA